MTTQTTCMVTCEMNDEAGDPCTAKAEWLTVMSREESPSTWRREYPAACNPHLPLLKERVVGMYPAWHFLGIAAIVDHDSGFADAWEVLSSPMTTWRRHLDRLNAEATREIVDHLSALVIRAARLVGYAQGRQGAKRPIISERHFIAVGASNDAATHVRRALGFTVPRDRIDF